MFKPGDPRPEGAGRKKGVPTKSQLKRKSLEEKAGALGFDPFEMLVLVAKGDHKALGMEADEDGKNPISLSQRTMAAAEVLQYMHPKRKAVEHSGEISNGENREEIDRQHEELRTLIGSTPRLVKSV